MKMIIPLKTTILTVMLGASTFNASAAWQVSGTFCQSYTDDGRVLVRVRPATIGLIEQQPQCNGRGSTELAGSNFSVNGSSYPSSVMCNAQSNYQAVQTTTATKDIQNIISMLQDNQSVSINTFGSRSEVNTADFAQACSSIINQKVANFDPQKTYQQDMAKMGYKQDENGQWHKQSKQAYSREADPEIAANYDPKAGVAENSGKGGFYGDGANKNLYGPGSQAQKDAEAANEARRLAAQNHMSKSATGITEPEMQAALAAAKKAYAANYDQETLASADFGSYKQAPSVPDPADKTQKLRVVEYEVFNPGYKTYDKVRVTLNASGAVTGTQVQYEGQ
ncbi:hypothetical protein QNZ44_003048 [Enterobacter kobei]